MLQNGGSTESATSLCERRGIRVHTGLIVEEVLCLVECQSEEGEHCFSEVDSGMATDAVSHALYFPRICGYLLVFQNSFTETRQFKLRWPHIGAGHRTTLGGMRIWGGIKFLPAKFKAFLQVPSILRVVISAKERRIPLEIRRLSMLDLKSPSFQRSTAEKKAKP